MNFSSDPAPIGRPMHLEECAFGCRQWPTATFQLTNCYFDL